MTRRVLFLPFAALVVLAGVLGWQMGQPVSETAIIERYAAQYVRVFGDGAAVTDCLAVPGEGDVRLTVVCTHPGGGTALYPVDARGGLILETGGPEA